MKKQKRFDRARFPAKTFLNAAKSAAKGGDLKNIKISTLKCTFDHETWHYDSIDEFLSDYQKKPCHGYFWIKSEDISIFYSFYDTYSDLSVEANSRSAIESIFNYFENDFKEAQHPDGLPDVEIGRVFIGHGRSNDWRNLKDHLQDQHSYAIQCYETGTRAGHTIRDILEDMIDTSSFAILVLTAEDEQVSGGFRARQNVIHEAGLFQGKLGFKKAIMLVENGVEIPSNLDGIQYIKFDKGRIRETFGDVVATLKREFSEIQNSSIL